MKSSQLNFFILPKDLEILEEIFIKYNALFITQPIFDTDKIFTDTIRYPLKDGQFDKIYLTTKEFYNNVIIEKVEKQQYYLVDEILSEVVEFSRGGFLYSKNKLERARFYYIHSYFKDNISIEKSPEFKKWTNDIFKAVKKHVLIIDKSNDTYLSNNAQTWMIENKASLQKSGLYISV